MVIWVEKSFFSVFCICVTWSDGSEWIGKNGEQEDPSPHHQPVSQRRMSYCSIGSHNRRTVEQFEGVNIKPGCIGVNEVGDALRTNQKSNRINLRSIESCIVCVSSC